MRELNQKIYEIAEMESPDEEASVSIGQVITDNILEEQFDNADTALSREEADKVIKEERETIYGREKKGPTTATNVKVQQAFSKSGTRQIKRPSSTGKTQVKKVSKKVAKKGGKKVVKKVSKKASESNNNVVILVVGLVAAAAVYYFFGM